MNPRLRYFRFTLILIATVCITACNKCSLPQQKTVVLVENPELLNEEVKKIISKELTANDTSSTLVIALDSLYSTKYIIDFYKQNDFNVAWTNKGNLNKQGQSLLFILKNADEYGLIPDDYHFHKIDSLVRTKQDSITKKFDAVKVSETELLLTDAFFTFAIHLHKGRLNIDSLTREWKGTPADIKLVDVLNSAIKNNTIHSAIDTLEPQNEGYQKLKLALKYFKIEFKYSDWDSIGSPKIDSASFNARLKKRLIASHDYFEDPNNSDSINLMKAIQNFQFKHHLNEDGKIGKQTLIALRKGKQDAIRQIEINMERWRLYGAPKEKQFVWVNIPKYEMSVTEEDTLVMKSRIICGQPTKQTPLLKSTIRYFIIYPYWTVPVSIATKELLPVLKRDTSYIRKNNFDVLDSRNNIVDPQTINWKKYSKNYFPWKLRQRTGEDNSLGVLKFNFDNKYGVYLHDTNNHRLFSKEVRALSHGCVRLEKFMDFAEFLIRDDSVRYPLNDLKMDLLEDQQKYVYLVHPIVIYIRYFTAEVDENNLLFFYNDIYNRDEKMMNSLYKKHND